MAKIDLADRYRIKSVDKAISILEMMALERKDLTVTEIGHSLKMGKGTVHRFLSTLKARKFVQQDAETKKYGFGIRAYDLGISIRKEAFLKNLMIPELRELASQCRESVNAAILEYDEIIYIAHLESEETLRFYMQEGSRLPATCTAMGKVLLSSLPNEVLLRMFTGEDRLKRQTKYSIDSVEQLMRVIAEVRKKNLAYDREECFLGVSCIAAPIRNYRNDIIAAISITAPKIRMKAERTAELAKLLTASAEEISKEF